jgi:RNA polymerase sigma-70 factor, ECF subfamily
VAAGRSSLTTTPVSLLERLKVADRKAPEWQQFQEVYLPLIFKWLSRVPNLGVEAEDLAQESLLIAMRELPSFERRREGSFRAWLRQIVVNQSRNYLRQRGRRPIAGIAEMEGFINQLEAPTSDLAKEWDRQHDRHVFRRLLSIVQRDFAESTWQAFEKFAVQGLSLESVAADLGLTENAVLLAKSHVLRRLRDEAAGLID